MRKGVTHRFSVGHDPRRAHGEFGNYPPRNRKRIGENEPDFVTAFIGGKFGKIFPWSVRRNHAYRPVSKMMPFPPSMF
ncbi:MAG: hypothetical protein BWY32_03660 [bacterium ADurb.Bin243]|nr:MAG: hypothetical protein BWY32_03660 [bacterium ADurb.Bin243]